MSGGLQKERMTDKTLGRVMRRDAVIKMTRVLWIVAVLIGALMPQIAVGETVMVKYRGPVDLAPFQCEWITRSSFIQRLCYDPKESYVVVNLNGTYYHYCEVPPHVISEWRAAESMGRYFNAAVKDRFDCRLLRMPTYGQ
jgi:hypothetical protein